MQLYMPLIREKIEIISKETFRKGMTRIDYHNALQWNITLFAKTLGYEGVSEFEIPITESRGKGGGNIDVVWLHNLKPVALIEIDSSRKRNSIEKLMIMQAPYKIWIYYGGRKFRDRPGFENLENIEVLELKKPIFERKRRMLLRE